MSNAPSYERIVNSYQANLYIKGKMSVQKKNLLFRYLPFAFKMQKNVPEYIVETYSDLNYTAPNIYNHQVKASLGTIDSKTKELRGELPEYFHINIYSSSLLHKKLLSPLASNGEKYYKYQLEQITGNATNQNYKITFTPKINSYQLVKGYMIVSEKTWSIREIRFAGQSEYLHFDNLVKTGDAGNENEFLPVYNDLKVTYIFLGNILKGEYIASLDYRSIELQKEKKRQRQKKNYDLSDTYIIQRNADSLKTDTTSFISVRPIELTKSERALYANYFLRRDTAQHNKKSPTGTQIFRGEMNNLLLNSHTFSVERVSVNFSPLINPVLFSYSGTDGISYKQRLRYNQSLSNGGTLSVIPQVGYAHKIKELYWSVSTTMDYLPQKRASIRFDIGNGNRIYGSDILDELKEIPDSVFDFNKIHLDYFRDLYLKCWHSIEITNGLNLNIGFAAHRRTAVNASEFVPVKNSIENSIPTSDDEITEKFRNTYISIAPHVKVEWTPGQYYYMKGNSKINLHSDYPTFSVDWERGLKGILNSTGKYERWEVDIQHHISLGLLNNLYYRAGGGTFSNQEQLYFVDFVNFSKSNLPVGWNDDIGGIFQLLDRRWYNSSRHYVRANVTYEAPFLLLSRLRKFTRNILNERLYMGILSVPRLNPYWEIGYGIGTHVFDAGVFVNNINGKFSQIGFKITFELFNR
ncbi:hypothetical protein EZS27_003049 [termite gut metagenome]|uniref:Uncharacterized protein n=1 Tax=termite gut metagenome TaxID=433724 RepID=A0A5J4SUC3_9ZZZZ